MDKEQVKLRQDFTTMTEFLDYLMSILQVDIPRSTVINRLNRGWHPHKIVTTKTMKKPSNSHPYKLTYGQKL